MSQQLTFAQKYRGWSAEERELVVWIDESTFEIGNFFEQVHIWRTAYERYSLSCIVPTSKSG